MSYKQVTLETGFLLLTALLLFMAAACTSNTAVDRTLNAADSLSNELPDSALRILDTLRLPSSIFNPPSSRLMRLELLRARCMNKTSTPFTTDSVLNTVVSYYDSHGTPNERMEAHYLLGCTYRDMGEAPRAVDCYLDAAACADTTAKDCNYSRLSSIFSQMADIYYYQLLLTKVIETRKKAMKYAELANDTLTAITELKLSAGAYILLNKRDSAEHIVKEAMRLYRIHGHQQYAIQASTILMHIYCEEKEHYKDLKPLVDSYDSECNLFDSLHELSGNKRLYYYYKGRYLEQAQQLDSAECYYRKIHHPGMALTAKNSMYKGLLSVFKKRHNADSIAKYAELYCAVNDSSIILKDQQQTSIVDANYKYTSFQNQLYNSELRAYRLTLYLVILSVFLLIASSTTVFFVRRYRKRQQQKREQLEKKYQEELKKLIIQQKCKEEELERIRVELEEHKKGLARMEEISNEKEIIERVVSEKEIKIARLSQDIEKLKEEKDIISRKLVLTDRAREFTMLPIYKKVRQVAEHPKDSISDEEWQNLEQSFRDHLPHLYQDVISLNDKNKPLRLRICILTAMGIKNGEQSNILGVTKQNITNNMTTLNELLFHEKTSRTFYTNIIEHYNIFV